MISSASKSYQFSTEYINIITPINITIEVPFSKFIVLFFIKDNTIDVIRIILTTMYPIILSLVLSVNNSIKITIYIYKYR